MKSLIISPYFNRTTPGESWSSFKWVQGISERTKATILTTHKKGWKIDESLSQDTEIVNWQDPRLPSALARLDWELKPGYILFYLRTRKYIRDQINAGRQWDIAHQINPLAMRYPSPLASFNIPYLIGPLAGSLETPAGFKTEGTDKSWFRKLRALDGWRMNHDPLLRRSIRRASVVFGVAPYVGEFLKKNITGRFEIASETGVEKVASKPKLTPLNRPVRFLFVGRLIRTKGIIDAIKAAGAVSRSMDIEFNIVGTGDLLEECRSLIYQMNCGDKIRLHGRLPRTEVDEWYSKSDVFLFPSFREPSGNVVFEAMSHGLPVITCDAGGPGHVVTTECGWKLKCENPEQLKADIAATIRDIVSNPKGIETKSLTSIDRIKDIAFWPSKIDNVLQLYSEILSSKTTRD